MSPLIVASVLEPGALAGLVRDALREAGADPVTPTNGLRAWDGIVHDCAPAAACAIEGILASSRDDVAVPILVVASDNDRVRRLLGQSAGMGTLRWVQPGEQDVEHRLDAAVRQLVEQAAAARVHRILALARPGLPRAVHAVSRAFLNRLAGIGGSQRSRSFSVRSASLRVPRSACGAVRACRLPSASWAACC